MGIVVMLPTLALLFYLFWRDRKAEKSITDESYLVPTKLLVMHKMKMQWVELNEAWNKEVMKHDFDLPLIHSTKHNTTIYAHKADA